MTDNKNDDIRNVLMLMAQIVTKHLDANTLAAAYRLQSTDKIVLRSSKAALVKVVTSKNTTFENFYSATLSQKFFIRC